MSLTLPILKEIIIRARQAQAQPKPEISQTYHFMRKHIYTTTRFNLVDVKTEKDFSTSLLLWSPNLLKKDDFRTTSEGVIYNSFADFGIFDRNKFNRTTRLSIIGRLGWHDKHFTLQSLQNFKHNGFPILTEICLPFHSKIGTEDGRVKCKWQIQQILTDLAYKRGILFVFPSFVTSDLVPDIQITLLKTEWIDSGSDGRKVYQIPSRVNLMILLTVYLQYSIEITKEFEKYLE